MEPLVSIIIPVHNAEKTLDRAVMSCLSQKSVSVEAILVENGSGDKSAAICRQFTAAYENVRYESSEIAGVSRARNIGLSMARGKYIGFVDADDYIENTMYQELSQALEDTGNALAICEYYLHDSARSRITQDLTTTDYRKQDMIHALIGKMYEDDPVMMGSVWRCLFRRDFLQANHLMFDEELEIGEDLLFLLDAVSRTDCVSSVQRPLYHYVNSLTSVSNSIKPDTWSKYCRFFHKLLESVYYVHGDYSDKKRIENKVKGLSGWIIKDSLYAGAFNHEKVERIHAMIDDRKVLLAACERTNGVFEMLIRHRCILLLYIRYGLMPKVKRRLMRDSI